MVGLVAVVVAALSYSGFEAFAVPIDLRWGKIEVECQAGTDDGIKPFTLTY